MYVQQSRWARARDRLAEIDVHKACFATAVASTILDILLCLASLFPYYLDESINNFSFVQLSESVEDRTHAEIILFSAVPMLAAIASVLLMFANRLKVGVPYPLFLLFNTLLIIWNSFIALAIYIHVLPQIENDQGSKLCQGNCGRFILKLHLYSAFLIFSMLAQMVFNFIVFRGWQVLKDTI
ncbi:hypothetical protein M3Y97_00189000 [Aphelenchoides bicaudatus]|nr:hypothetical protein M3Y97_00189000 [Aphelenchoides bicaudatus]